MLSNRHTRLPIPIASPDYPTTRGNSPPPLQPPDSNTTVQANQRLEQALSRSTESERISAELGLEAQQLRERLSEALDKPAAVAGNKQAPDNVAAAAGTEGGDTGSAAAQDSADDSDARNTTEDAAANDAAAAIDGLKRDLEQATRRLQENASTLGEQRERCAELQTRLAAERTISEELREGSQALLARAEGAERTEGEAMAAAAAEARRAAEVREAAEVAEAELSRLRGRAEEWEEEERRAAELKGTLESTRDALDELR